MESETAPRFGDIAHLGHVELLTPKPDESLTFFTAVVGLHETARAGDSVYLRAWGDYERHTLKLTAHKTSGLGHVGLRARDDATLQRLVAGLDAHVSGGRWIDEPGGNRFEIGSGGYLILDPDWKPIVWTQAERAQGQAWGLQTVSTFHTHGTPPVEQN